MFRTDKVASAIGQSLAQLLQIELAERFGIISVNKVYVAKDLKTADIFVSCVDKTNGPKLVAYLNQNKNHYKKHISDKLSLRYTPNLTFKYDDSLNDIDRVEELLEGLGHGA
jgi:ribosome-binding factor A